MNLLPSIAIIGSRGYPSYYGGFETLVRRLAPFLTQEGWSVTVFGRRRSVVDGDPHRDSRVHSVNTWGLDRKIASTLSYGMSAALCASYTKPDVALILNVANGYWLPFLKARHIPTVVNVDGIEWERDKWGRVARCAFRCGAALTAKYATEIVCDSTAIRQYWRERFNRTGVYIAYGADVPATIEPIDTGLEHHGYILLVARLVPENTIQEFFDAATTLSREIDIVIVGTSGHGGALDDRARKLAASNRRIHWLGHVRDDRRLISLWQHAAVYFHGHSVGGTNPSLVQSVACNVRIVARDTSYNREVLGARAIYTPPIAREIVRGIRQALDQAEEVKAFDDSEFRDGGRFSWKTVCRKYSEILAATANPGE